MEEVVLFFVVAVIEVLAFQIVERYAKKRNKSVELCKFEFSSAVCILGMASTFVPMVFHFKFSVGIAWFVTVLYMVVMHHCSFPSHYDLIKWREEDDKEMKRLEKENSSLRNKNRELEKENAILRSDLEYYRSEE